MREASFRVLKISILDYRKNTAIFIPVRSQNFQVLEVSLGIGARSLWLRELLFFAEHQSWFLALLPGSS